MTIRRLEKNDREELIKLLIAFDEPDYPLSKENSTFREYKKDISLVAAEVADDYLNNPMYIIFVAEQNGQIEGCIVGEIKSIQFRKYDKEGYMTGWYVHPEYRHHGIGKDLFEKLVEEFKKANCTHIALDTKVENIKAIEIYEHMGFFKRTVSMVKLVQDL
jgi:ribosomal protein S18 acetylase RimI-like enzyme